MSDDWVELMTELRDQQQQARQARARIPKNCFFCDRMAQLPGYCEKFEARPPAAFMAQVGACPDFIEEIPF